MRSILSRGYSWVPSLYFMQALPFAFVTAVSPVFYKNFNVSNSKIAFYSSLLALPWLLKPFLAPPLEAFSKRKLTVFMEVSMAVLFSLLAWSLQLTNFLFISGMVFLLLAAVSAIHDINSDGLYIVSLDPQAQAHFVGIRTLFYQLGKLLCQGGLVLLVGYLAIYWIKPKNWQIGLLLCAAIIFIIAVYHQQVLPMIKTEINRPNFPISLGLVSFKKVFADFFALPHFAAIVSFVIIYNLPEAQLIKVVPLFLLDKPAQGGLGLDIAAVGFIYGGIGIIGMLIGIILSGFLLSKFNLKYILVPMMIFTGLTNLAYVILSATDCSQLWVIGGLIAIAQLGFGLGNGAYMFYLLRIFNRGSYPMSLYAIGTTLMGLGMIIGGAISGYLQLLLGYNHFFIWVVALNFIIAIYSVYIINKRSHDHI